MPNLAQQKEILEKMLEGILSCTPEIQSKISALAIQEKYRELFEYKDMDKAKILYSITRVKPEKSMQNASITSRTVAIIPLTCDYVTLEKIKTHDLTAIDDILRLYKPCKSQDRAHKFIQSPKDKRHRMRRESIATSDDAYSLILMNNSHKLEVGKRYFFPIPIMRDVNILGNYLGSPYLDIAVEPKASWLISVKR